MSLPLKSWYPQTDALSKYFLQNCNSPGWLYFTPVFGCKVSVHKFIHRDIFAYRVKPINPSHILSAFPVPVRKGMVSPYGQFVGRLKPPTVHKMCFPIHMVLELIPPILSDGFSSPKYPVLRISPRCHSYPSFVILDVPVNTFSKFCSDDQVTCPVLC